jgi:predicted nucleotidyltransferase
MREMAVFMSMHSDLERQVRVIAEWAEELPLRKVYIFGSRVRGDATADSDLDVAIEFEPPQAVNKAMWNWQYQNDTDFADLKRELGVTLSLHSDPGDSAWAAIWAGAMKPVLSVGKVFCVITPPGVQRQRA